VEIHFTLIKLTSLDAGTYLLQPLLSLSLPLGSGDPAVEGGNEGRGGEGKVRDLGQVGCVGM